MRDLILSTGNKNKVKEIKEILKDLDYNILDKNEAGFESLDIEENGDSLEENSLIKARAMWKELKKLVIADDTGLFVDELDGEPGIYSARYAGESSNDQDNRKKLLRKMKNIENRKARFITSIAVIDERGNEKILRGICEGKISRKEIGLNGFGYDPIFIPQGYDKSFGEISNEIKNEISHRAKALKELKKYLNSL
ncbi:MAG: RdgB/HAM1 family non-canonical purine NTP pyrophosphatase [Andreesenia angusta]|nr:RdgB/HAM1 family non-canonical purine NTP pyrophosphatase [Andreesenia angusta]